MYFFYKLLIKGLLMYYFIFYDNIIRETQIYICYFMSLQPDNYKKL